MDGKQDRDSLFEKHRENIYFRWGLTGFVVISLCVVVAQFVTKLPAVFGFLGALMRTMAPVFYGLGIAYLLDPVVGRVQLVLEPLVKKPLGRVGKADRSQGVARGLGVVVALALLVLIVWTLLSMVLPQLLDSVYTIIRNMPVYYDNMRAWVEGVLNDNLGAANFTGEVMDQVYEYVTGWLTDSLLPRVQAMVVSLTTSVVEMARALLNLIIGLIISIYLLMGKDRFLARTKKVIYALLGVRRGGYFCNICTFANQAFGGFIGGKIIDSAIIGVLCFIGLSLMKMPYTMLISIIVGVTNIIPFFGPYLGAIPSALLLLVINPMQALYFVIFILILQQLDGNVIGPKILGNATGVSSFWVVVSILVFGSLYGILGMILAVPTFAVLYKLATELVNWALGRRGLSTASDDYLQWDYPPRPEADHWRTPRKRRKAARKIPAPPAGEEDSSEES